MSADVSTSQPEGEGHTPFVGRDAERKALDEAVAAVKGGATRVVTVLGPAGIGKSRLIQDMVLRDASSSKPLRVYRGAAYDGATAFGLFARLLRARFGITEGTDKDTAREQMRSQVAAVLDDRKVGDVLYFLGQFLGLPCEESPLTRAFGDDAREAEMIRRAVFKAFPGGRRGQLSCLPHLRKPAPGP